MSEQPPDTSAIPRNFGAAEIGAIAHLYRGEIYRSTIWRTRLDNTTNWAIVTTGLALSITFAGKEATPLPMILVGLLITVFLFFEARRYRYFNIWRARARFMETEFYAPLLRHQDIAYHSQWNEVLARDYCIPHYHISLSRAIGRRLRRNYVWVLGVQAVAYYGKLLIHPTPLQDYHQLFERAAVGPISGEWVVFSGMLFHSAWLLFALITWRQEVVERKLKNSQITMG
ncbi:MAG: DUF2270 domain-containing protein [Thiolinea sp.]